MLSSSLSIDLWTVFKAGSRLWARDFAVKRGVDDKVSLQWQICTTVSILCDFRAQREELSSVIK